jgi:hypothetical protein
VTLRDGPGGRRHVFLLGDHDSPESRTEYFRRLAEWEQNGRRLTLADATDEGLTVNELLAKFLQHLDDDGDRIDHSKGYFLL